MLALGIAVSSGTAMAQDQPVAPAGSLDELRHAEAQAAMAEGDFYRARQLYLTILIGDPNDATAAREAGRASHALGDFAAAVSELSRAHELSQKAADAELHYLLGEALYAVGRNDEARRIHDLAVGEISPTPTERMQRLWLARIHARRGELPAADALYAAILREQPRDEEALVARIEAHTLCKAWPRAEELTRQFLYARPDHQRGREILAWILEVRGSIDEETILRGDLAEAAAPVDRERTIAHGRSLERARNFHGALVRYRQALALGTSSDPALKAAIERLENQLSLETAVGGAYRTDPSGSSTEVRVGVAVPISGENAVSLTASYDLASASTVATDANSATVTTGLLLGHGREVTSALMVSGNYHRMTMAGEAVDFAHVGAAAEVRIGTGSRFQLHARADLNMPWREAANTIREGGRYDGLTAHAYALPLGPRLVIDAGVQARRMELEDLMPTMQMDANGRQYLFFGGLDYVLQVDPTHVARGQILDEEMLWPTYLADSVVLHYRHYEGFTRDDFGERLVLSERNTIDEVGGTVRRTFGRVLGAELRAGTGYDFARELTMWRAGGALLASPSANTRFTFSYDIANESTDAFVGRRHTGWITFHADL